MGVNSQEIHLQTPTSPQNGHPNGIRIINGKAIDHFSNQTFMQNFWFYLSGCKPKSWMLMAYQNEWVQTAKSTNGLEPSILDDFCLDTNFDILTCSFFFHFSWLRIWSDVALLLHMKWSSSFAGIDWCCFCYFVRNSLAALLSALCAQNAFFGFEMSGFLFF